MRNLEKVSVFLSRVILLVTLLGALVGSWFHFGYINVKCHPMFTKAYVACGQLETWASEHLMIAGSVFLPYRSVWNSDRDLVVAGGIAMIAVALLIQVLHRFLQKRRKRKFGAFSDVPGFRPIH